MQSDPESSTMGSDCSSPVRSSGSPPKYNSTGFNRLTASRGTGNHTTEFQGHFLIKRPTKWSNAAEQNLSALGGRSSDTAPEISRDVPGDGISQITDEYLQLNKDITLSTNEPNLVSGSYSPGFVRRLKEQYESKSIPSSSPDTSRVSPEGNSKEEQSYESAPLICSENHRGLARPNVLSDRKFAAFLKIPSVKKKLNEIFDESFEDCSQRPMTAPSPSEYTSPKHVENKGPSNIDSCESRESVKPIDHDQSESQFSGRSGKSSYLPFPVASSKSFIDRSFLDGKTPFFLSDSRPYSPVAGFRNESSVCSTSSYQSLSTLSGLSLAESTSRITISPMQNEYPVIANYLIRKSDEYVLGHNLATESFRSKVLRICGQRKPIPMSMIFQSMEKIEKLGEGVFGEVYLGYFNGGQTQTSRVYKVVVIEGDELVNGEKQKKFEEILPEIIVSQQVSKLHEKYNNCSTDGFIKMHNVRITVGDYTKNLVKAWVKWDKLNDSDNACPSFKPDQLYVVFEYDHGGKDVEPFTFTTARQSFSLVLQVAHILAVGEEALEMEHRDLHWGNVLVESTESPEIKYVMKGVKFTVPSQGIKARIIDFTLARLMGEDGHPIYLDLGKDEEQFLGTGDHQFNIYRMMRDYNRNDWSLYCPKSNCFWVHYLADKLIRRGRYEKPDSATHNFFLRKLLHLSRRIMCFDSCSEFVMSPLCEQFKDNTRYQEFPEGNEIGPSVKDEELTFQSFRTTVRHSDI